MKRIFNYVLKHKALLIIPSIAMLMGIIADMFNPYLAKIIVGDVIQQGKTNLLLGALLGLLMVSVLRTILGYVKEYLFDVLSAEVNKDIKQDLFDHILTLPFSYFDNMNTGELMSRINEDVENIWKTISFGLRLFVENIIYFILATSLLFYLNWKLALACLVLMLPIAYIAIVFEKKVGTTYDKISDQAAILNTTAQENIAGVRLVKAFAREKHEIFKFLRMNKENYELNMEQSGIVAKYLPQTEFLTNLAQVVMIIIGGILIIRKDPTGLDVATLVAFQGYISMLVWPMKNLGWLTNMLAQNSASAKKIFTILDTDSDIKNIENPVVPSEIKGHIVFDNVTFKYNDQEVLNNINLDIKPGSTVAIMGTTGSGKSSIINLIGRYYDPSEGSIIIDGVNVKNLDLKTLRKNMSVVPQDTFLFSDSILENIRIGNKNASMEEIAQACEMACAMEFIQDLEEGFDTIIGERGIGLSGGQKQRLAITRALVRKGSIMILDDATSALDMETEYELLKNLNSLNKKATTFIIAHRISAVKNADLIVYLENGQIVEKGTHNELLALKGRYYDIYCDQFKDFEDVESEVV
ncbi:putative multidrug export ATP-binding/permease protein [Clostridium sp. N3C]|uniref:ABC transporter ATP-binding protein n=1 Tax=Clostridium sp. N3C TaxID=1776758 RepID=UPI00092E18A4|nr:ABC transporter ATP-binding protein [Clostridium sp. N3C]SCN23097.1 putative multidrug export ATP-binding/permease protein [Clostridium sp. N3C]